jgi:hypothetical protein
MNTKPLVAPGDWVDVEFDEASVAALVCSTPMNAPAPSVEAIYTDEDTHVRLALLKWEAGGWSLAHPKSKSGYADNYARVAGFVDLLRRGRKLGAGA